MKIEPGFKILFEKRVFEFTGERISGGDLIFTTGEYLTRIGINVERVWMYHAEYLESILNEIKAVVERDGYMDKQKSMHWKTFHGDATKYNEIRKLIEEAFDEN